MARAILCDSGDGEPYRYLVSEFENGTTVAYCEQHWYGMCVDVVMALAEQMPGDEPEPEPEPDPGQAAPELEPGQAEAVVAELRHRDRTRERLAARPDAPATSEAAGITVPKGARSST